jgi:hypothetical protein
MLDLFFGLEEEGNMFLQNVGRIPQDYAALYARKENVS